MINQLIQIVYYKQVKIRIDMLGMAKVIFNKIVNNYGIFNSIDSNKSSAFTSKF